MLFTIPAVAADSAAARSLCDELTDTMPAFFYDAADVPAPARDPDSRRAPIAAGVRPRRVA